MCFFFRKKSKKRGDVTQNNKNPMNTGLKACLIPCLIQKKTPKNTMNATVSIFKDVKDPSNPFQKSLFYALDRIKKGNSKVLIEQLRGMSDEEYRKNKKKLPGVCFNGQFKTRCDSNLIAHSGVMILDFDKFPSYQEAVDFKNSICDNEYIFSCWISPSGKGIKALVKIPADATKHKAYFNSIEKYFNHPNWDNSGKDVSRFCFESYDPDLYLNMQSSLWCTLDEPDFEDIGTYSPIVRMTSSNIIIENLITWWTNKYGMTKGNKNDNIYKLARAFNDFGIHSSDALHECLKYDEGGKAKEIESVLISAYKNNATFGTKAFEDHLRKEKIEKLIRGGKSKKDIEKDFKDVDIDLLKQSVDIDEFWIYNDKGKINLSTHKFKFWLEQNNFYKYYPSESSNTFTFIKKEQNLLEETSEKRIKDYVLNNILGRDNIGYAPYDYMAQNTSYFRSDFLSMLDTTDINIKEDTASKCFLYYKNCVVEVTENAVKEIEYLDIDGFVWKRQIIQREFIKEDHHSAVFRKFLWLIAGKDVSKYNSFKSVIGYLLHSYKTSANNKAIIFNDESISENPNGGSGKGLFWNALKSMKQVSSIDGKMFEFTKSFPYQTVSTDTQILVFDDVRKNFNFESLFSLITEGITLEYKGQDAISIPVEQSPKILITTNYTIGGTGGSFERRKFEVEMSSYFSYKHTPLDEFGHMLFSDWDDVEWHRFDNFMINCVQYYLKNGLVKHEFNNLEVRKFIKETSFEFYEWTQDRENLPHNIRIDKTEYYNKFMSEYQDFKKWLSQKKFTQWLEEYGKFYALEQQSGRTHLMRYIIFSESIIKQEEEDEFLF